MNKPDTSSIVSKVRSGKLTERELINLYKNATERDALDVVEAIKLQMRNQFPRAARRLFGAKTAQAIAVLEDVLKKISVTIDLNGNAVKNGVKPGGHMLSGKMYVNVYASYRNSKGYGVFFSLDQDTAESELVAVVGEYKVGTDRYANQETFTIDRIDEARERYEQLLLMRIAVPTQD